MSALTIIEQNTIKELPVNYQPFIAAKFGTQIKMIAEKDLFNKCVDIITIICVSAGTKDQTDERVLTFLSNELFTDLKSPKYNHLCIQEIEHALRLGVRLEYGQFFGINITTIHGWIKAYLADRNRELAMAQYKAKIDEQEQNRKPVIMTPEFFRNAAINAFNEYKADGKIPVYPAAIYDTIVEQKNLKTLIKKEQYNDILKQALIEYKEQIKHLPKDITQGWKEDVKENLVLKNRVKKVALIRYFESLISEGKDLSFE